MPSTSATRSHVHGRPAAIVALLLLLASSCSASSVAGEGQVEFSKLCFEQESICYHYSPENVFFSGLGELTSGFCPEDSWLVTVFGRRVQDRLEELVERFRRSREEARIVLAMKTFGSIPHWVFGRESRVPLEYANWAGELPSPPGADDCVYVSDSGKWQISSCSGPARVVCMTKLCSWSWEVVEDSSINFENGQRFPGVQNLDDCKTYCETVESSCLGVFMSSWNHCWLFPSVVRVEDDGAEQTLHLKSSRSVCSVDGSDVAHVEDEDLHKWHMTADDHVISQASKKTKEKEKEKKEQQVRQEVGEEEKEKKKKKKKKDMAQRTKRRTEEEEEEEEGRLNRGKRAADNVTVTTLEEEPPEDQERQSVMEPLYKIIMVVNLSLIMTLVSIRIATFVLDRLTAKKKIDGGEDRD